MVAMSNVAIAYNRFGLGAQPSAVQTVNPKQWLIRQLDVDQAASHAWQKHPKTDAIIRQYFKRDNAKFANKNRKQEMQKSMRKGARQHYTAAVGMRMNSALTTTTPFVERLVHFWANHFAVSVDKPQMLQLASGLEVDAIRPHVLGNFKTMLMAVEKHPAMLVYLNQFNAIGSNSPAGLRANKRKPSRKRGLNENLAREIMELHTLGVRSGYTQTDVTELAKALTGWSINNGKLRRGDEVDANGYAFKAALHEPGNRVLLNKHYPQQGKHQAEAMLNDLAISPSTAKHIATKLARHFVADKPPKHFVEQLANTFIKTGGDLPSIYIALINGDAAWQSKPAKFKTPWEWAVSALRALGVQNADDVNVAKYMKLLGQAVWKPGSPAGFGDTQADWLSSNALLRRVELARRIAQKYGASIDGRLLAHKVLVGALSAETSTEIARSESAESGLALLLVSPEFMRR